LEADIFIAIVWPTEKWIKPDKMVMNRQNKMYRLFSLITNLPVALSHSISGRAGGKVTYLHHGTILKFWSVSDPSGALGEPCKVVVPPFGLLKDGSHPP